MRPDSPVVESALDTAPVIPEHELLRPIASGAYGQVWLARSTLGTLRAVKIVRRDRFDRSDDFEREFRGLQRFEPVSRTHEALVDILQIGRQDDWFYYVMELADDAEGNRSDGATECSGDAGLGDSQHSNTATLQHSAAYVPQTLRQRIRDRGYLPAADVVPLGQRLASALVHLHGAGLVHRDVKPSNILFINGQPKLADAGLVAPVDDARSLVGTPGYIPPEGPGTPQADIYSLGKVLYEAAFGKDRQDFPQLPPDLAARPDHAALLELNEIIAKACAQDPRQRHANPPTLLAELQMLQRGHSVKRTRVLQHLWSRSKKVGIAAGVVALVLIGVLRFARTGGDEHPRSKNREVNRLMDQANVESYDIAQAPKVIESYKKAVGLDPDFAPAWAGLFTAYMGLGGSLQTPADFDSRLREVAARLARLSPDSAETHIALAITDWNGWRFQNALKEAHDAVQKHEISQGGLHFAHAIYAFYLIQSGQPVEALKEYQRAEDKDGADPFVQNQLGHPYFVLGKLDEAMKHYEEALRFQSTFFQAHRFKGFVFEQKKSFPAAIDEFEAAALGQGRSAQSTTNFYNTLRKAVRQGGERGYWEKRLELALDDPSKDRYYIATLYARLEDKPKAYFWLRQACEHKSFSEGLLFDLCWDHNDPEFQAIARGIGLMR